MPPELTKLIKATFPNEAVFAEIAVSLTKAAAASMGFEGIPLSQIEVAVEEAVTNVQQHAYDAEENSKFDLICEMALTASTKNTKIIAEKPAAKARIILGNSKIIMEKTPIIKRMRRR